MNTGAGAFDAALAGLRGLPVNVVVTTGPGVDPAGLGAQPANVLVRQFLPQAALLPACDAVVSHAGAGTMLGGLCHGLPQVCLPMGADQPMNAAALARTGAGVALGHGERTAAAIRDAVITVLDDPSYRRAAGALQQQIAAMPSADETLGKLLELHSRRKALVRS
jgi:MGT family glycosyltransferase